MARIGSVARPDDSDESSSRATAPTAAGGAPRFATSSIVGRPGWNRTPRRPPTTALHKTFRGERVNLGGSPCLLFRRRLRPNLPFAPRVGFFQIPLLGATRLTPVRIPSGNPTKSRRRASFVRGARVIGPALFAEGFSVPANQHRCFGNFARSRRP